jgi:hypothetical protein
MNFLRTLWEETKLRCRVLWAAFLSMLFGNEITPVGRLFATVIRADGSREDRGLMSTKMVTDAGVAFLVDALQGTVEPEVLRFHGSGTGTTAESAAQTALVTEVESRVSGTLAEGASANIFRTVATIPYTATRAITEHAIFSASTVGTMLDRSVFTAINVINGDSIQFTYELTLPSGS